MNTASLPRITDADGTAGRLDLRPEADAAQVRLGDGSVVRVNRDHIREEDGGYRIGVAFTELESIEEPSREAGSETTVVEEEALPLVEEEVRLRKEKRETGRVRIRKRVEERTETIDEPLRRDYEERHGEGSWTRVKDAAKHGFTHRSAEGSRRKQHANKQHA